MIEEGKKVKVEYEGKLESGEVFDSSKDKDGNSNPLEFTVGSNQVIKGFEEEIKQMEKGEEKEFNIPAEKAYGDRKEELKKEIPKESLPQEKELKAGMVLAVQTPQGQFPVKIEEVKEKSAILDFNHPLAGKNLIFKVKVVDIQ